MTNDALIKTLSDVVGKNIRQLRKQRALSVEQLASLCAEAALFELTANTLYCIENGRRRNGHRTRKITVEELIALATVFDVDPMLLLDDQMVITVTVGKETSR